MIPAALAGAALLLAADIAVRLIPATEEIKVVLGIGTTLVGRLLCYDALAAEFRELRLARDPACPGCGADAVFSGYEDVVRICGSA
jgi:hypothetical protein